MECSTKCLVKINYFISVLMGVISFCYDQQEGRIYNTPLVTIYNALASIALFGLVPLFFRLDYNSEFLHMNINAVLVVIRTVGLLATVIFNWTKRQQLLATLNEVHNIRQGYLQRWPLSAELEKRYEYTIRQKLVSGFLTITITTLSCFEYVKMQFELNSFYASIVTIVMCSFVHLVMMNYFLFMAHLNVILRAINKELQKILIFSTHLWQLEKSQQMAGNLLKSKYCQMAQQLEELAKVQHQLHVLGNRINCMHEIQSLCIILMVYLVHLTMFYMTYLSLDKPQLLSEQFSLWTWLMVPLVLTIYYLDLIKFIQGIVEFQELSKETGELLGECQPLSPTMEVKLEDS
uniref:Gustatory receptor n=1 Tax=Stomoxys calcitrans TaxID=35570 RepID=A0A454A0S0_STOCA